MRVGSSSSGGIAASTSGNLSIGVMSGLGTNPVKSIIALSRSGIIDGVPPEGAVPEGVIGGNGVIGRVGVVDGLGTGLGAGSGTGSGTGETLRPGSGDGTASGVGVVAGAGAVAGAGVIPGAVVGVISGEIEGAVIGAAPGSGLGLIGCIGNCGEIGAPTLVTDGGIADGGA